METPLPSAPDHGILVVDDTLATLQILASILAGAGYHVRTATDGHLALRSAQSQPPDLILLDVRMPGLDGFEVCRQLKADERTQAIPIIFTTWLDEGRDKVRGFQAGAVDYIAKPFDNQEVLARIATHLALRQAQLQLQQTNQRLRIEIAERERAEATLREILENAFDAAYRRNLQTNTYDYMSPAFTRIAGYTPAEMLAMPIEAVLSCTHPEDVSAIQQTIQAAVAHPGTPGSIEYRFRHKAGHYLWLIDRLTALVDATGQPRSLVGSVRDITARKQAETALHDLNASLEQRIAERTAQLEMTNRELQAEIAGHQRMQTALRASEAKYRALFSEMMNGSALHEIVCDAAGLPVDYITLEVNKTYEGLLGVQGADVVGKKASAILPAAELEKWLGIFGPVAVTGQSTHYTMFSPANQRHFEGNAYCPEKGKFAVTFIDVTEREQAEAAVRASEARYRELAEENAHLLAQSRQDAETKAILLHEVNHRVKNNLAAIIGLLQLELRYLRGGEQTPYRSLVQDLTSRIQSLAMVHNLLSASLWSPLPLENLAKNVMQIAPVMLSGQQPVQMEVAPTPVHLTAKQASAVGLILNELATNSLKHAVRPSELICLSLQTHQSGEKLELVYRDNGPGYPAEILQGKRESVGLYLVEALAEHDLEGQITFSNDQGAVAHLRFTLVPDVQPANPDTPAPVEAQTDDDKSL